MQKTKKIKKIKNKSYKQKKTYKGGELIVMPNDLKNTHMCGKNIGNKDSPGLEIYLAIDRSFQLNQRSAGFLLDNFKKSKNMWFKFVLFNNSNIHYIYIITGAIINKHSVCLVHGLLDVTPQTEYSEMRQQFNEVMEFKSNNGIVSNAESMPLIQDLNRIINRDIPCMPVISAGSGTVDDDDPDNITICINNKSGHYKPTADSMIIAQTKFTEITGIKTVAVEKADKELLKMKYGENYEYYSGICL